MECARVSFLKHESRNYPQVRTRVTLGRTSKLPLLVSKILNPSARKVAQQEKVLAAQA